ncbi:ankyrin repeat domain-containing protein [Aspergillus clavatus NRRL 1]|uniref:Ankyrin repeat protein (Yar1), putative n=1 Tax=Aspergillus clavatus (strain ATCC 1007 / CBS 513.65 / DSM 816 / NCTC 3887 / NRRL 1 / QM 1276 / 107) TaxID=344612 RepID=A1CAA4_ASPCL|nr:ankyrin repeat protein (Yar1), putative [Aspergillus clavatus NRRL 1]EAW12672.1 ankyrin repeat protein (Yar1), putative [Aspergillus clavatus NRRL 1]
MSTPLTLSFEAIDDLIYDARSGDLEALKADLASQSKEHNRPEAWIIASAIDAEPEAEGGTGSCLLHFPAANGNNEILTYLLTALTAKSESPLSAAQIVAVVNHRNHSGNTPLHWAALNTHLECVKALVEAGADISIKNDAGLDAVFLAERTAWSTEEEGKGAAEGAEEEEEVEIEVGGEAEAGEEGRGEMSKGRQVVEWLLSSDKAGELESGVGGAEASASAPAAPASGEAMDVDEKK